MVIDREDKKVVKKGSYAVRADDEACATKRIHILGDNILHTIDGTLA